MSKLDPSLTSSAASSSQPTAAATATDTATATVTDTAAATDIAPTDQEIKEAHDALRRSRRASADLPAAAHTGSLLKRSRAQRSEAHERLWKRRYFALIGGSLIYYHSASHSDPPSVFVTLDDDTTISNCQAPKGFGLLISTRLQRLYLAADSPAERQQWINALLRARGEAPVEVDALLTPDEVAEAGAELAATSSGGSSSQNTGSIYWIKSTLASAFATSRLGKHLIKRYLDEAARILIHTVVEFVEVESGHQLARKMETFIFDLASRIAVIIRAQALPPDVNLSELQDDTILFCQEFIRYSRDRRLQAERRLHANADVSKLDVQHLLEISATIASTWRWILETAVSKKTIARYDAVIAHVFSDKQIRAIFEDVKHRERMETMERCLRELLETY